MKTLMRFLPVLAIGLLLALPSANAQTAMSSTTLGAAVTSTFTTSINLASTTGVTSTNTVIYVDKEAMFVNSVPSSGTLVSVTRGYFGTKPQTHASGAAVYRGAPTDFFNADPALGSCTASNYAILPTISIPSGLHWNCVNSTWMVDNGYVALGPPACNTSVSGNGTGTNGYTVLGTAPSQPVVQAQTSVTGTNTHYYVCNLNQIAAGLTTPRRQVAVIDVVFLYGVQTTGLGTQAAVLASGTMNAKAVFQKIAYPAAGALETATGLAEIARADSGTLVITPVVASFNVATTTAGEYYSAKFTPASPILMNVDSNQYFFTASLLNTATSATITNSPGILVHYAYIPD